MRIDGREVIDRVRSERERFVGLVLRDVQAIPEAERIRGQARFVNDHTLEVAEHTRIARKSIVIATGSRAVRRWASCSPIRRSPSWVADFLR